jgi:hypothetical protein
MSGKLQNDVTVNASITESNIPIQPEGNTQQLQEFDKVFIRLSKDKQALTVGDFELYKPESYFLNFYKKSQGGMYEGAFNIGAGAVYKTQSSLAVAKGTYVRQDIAITEGNQGPYKLQGNNGETFIIILAGTERVYIDGKLLLRGAENDYVIDYNAAEITFTTNQLLTKDKRVSIEFEYSDKNYFRTLIYWKNAYTTADNKLQMRLHVYSEQDSKNQPVDQTLDSLGRNVLVNAGDSVQDAFISSIDSIAFDPGRIMYKRIDSLGYDSIFVYSTNADSAKYVLVFSDVGQGNGNYVQTVSTANGKVYAWVAPVAGIPQGYAEPVVLLIAPGKKQMITLAGEYKFNNNSMLSSELAVTNDDRNTLSAIDNADNDGVAFQTKYVHQVTIDSGKVLRSVFGYEFAGKTFSPIERYRPVEFNRDWNILSTERSHEQYAFADLTLDGFENVDANLNTSSFIMQNAYTGFKQSAAASYHADTWIVNLNGSYLASSADTIQSNFFRPAAEIVKIFPALAYWRVGVRYDAEYNRLFEHADSVLPGSFQYDAYQMYLQSSDTAQRNLKFTAELRNDKTAIAGDVQQVTKGITYNADGNLHKNEKMNLRWKVSYRILEVTDTALTNLTPENSLLGRLQHSMVLKKGLFTSDLYYEAGTGQEPKREYTFVQVEPGLGVYTWNDYNENNIPELNEFEVAVFADEANYIQVYVPTTEYVQSNTTNFTYAVNINPKAVWFNAKGFRKLVGLFSGQSSLQSNKKVLDEKNITSYNPFAQVDDSILVSSNVYALNTIFFNRNASTFGMDYTLQNNFNKTLILNGPESRGKNEHRFSMRYKIIQGLTLNTVAAFGEKSLYSIAFASKNYTIPFYNIEPKLTFVSGSKLRVAGSYRYASANNTEGTETLASNAAMLDLKYNVVSKSTLQAKCSFIKMNFTGIAESTAGYAMLEGLQNGNNILWNLTIDRKLSQVLNLSLSYDGRKTGTADVVHVGRMQMRAVF